MDTHLLKLAISFIGLATLLVTIMCIYIFYKLKEIREKYQENKILYEKYDALERMINELKSDTLEHMMNDLEEYKEVIDKTKEYKEVIDKTKTEIYTDAKDLWKELSSKKEQKKEHKNNTIKYWRHSVPDYIQNPDDLIGASITFMDNKNFNYFVVSCIVKQETTFGAFNPLYLLDQDLPTMILPKHSTLQFTLYGNNFYVEVTSYDEITIVCYSSNSDDSIKCKEALDKVVQEITSIWTNWKKKYLEETNVEN